MHNLQPQLRASTTARHPLSGKCWHFVARYPIYQLAYVGIDTQILSILAQIIGTCNICNICNIVEGIPGICPQIMALYLCLQVPEWGEVSGGVSFIFQCYWGGTGATLPPPSGTLIPEIDAPLSEPFKNQAEWGFLHSRKHHFGAKETIQGTIAWRKKL